MSDSEQDSGPSIDGKTAQSLCEQFAEITSTDTACAQFFLQDHEWNLERSVDAYFETMANEVKPRQGKEATSAAHGDSCSEPVPKKVMKLAPLKIFSWNVDGLDEVDLKLRTKKICTIIKEELPDVVFLQEIVPASLAWYKKYLTTYEMAAGNEVGYFTLTLWRQDSNLVIQDSEVVPFPKSRMGRNFTIIKMRVNDAKLVFINTHLESTKEHSSERLRQLAQIFKHVASYSNDETVVFGGDLNLRDSELEATGGLPPDIGDLWMICGQRPECSYTWDTLRNDNKTFPGRFKPRLRFDRLYLRHSKPPRIEAKHFGFIGLERLKACRRFPSDHWGLVVYLDIL